MTDQSMDAITVEPKAPLPASTEYTSEQQAEHRAKWIEALRSGRFKQGRNRLRDGLHVEAENFCCLGVACELAAEAGITRRMERGYGNGYGPGRNATLPYSVADWLGLTDDAGVLTEPVEFAGDDGPRRATSLTQLNDDAGKTFAEIADLIEAGGVVVTTAE